MHNIFLIRKHFGVKTGKRIILAITVLSVVILILGITLLLFREGMV